MNVLQSSCFIWRFHRPANFYGLKSSLLLDPSTVSLGQTGLFWTFSLIPSSLKLLNTPQKVLGRSPPFMEHSNPDLQDQPCQSERHSCAWDKITRKKKKHQQTLLPPLPQLFRYLIRALEIAGLLLLLFFGSIISYRAPLRRGIDVS